MSFKLDLWNYQTWKNLEAEPRQEAGFCHPYSCEDPYYMYSPYNTRW